MGAVEWALVLALTNGGVWDTKFRFDTYKECYEYTVIETGTESFFMHCPETWGDGKQLSACYETLVQDSKTLCLPVKD